MACFRARQTRQGSDVTAKCGVQVMDGFQVRGHDTISLPECPQHSIPASEPAVRFVVKLLLARVLCTPAPLSNNSATNPDAAPRNTTVNVDGGEGGGSSDICGGSGSGTGGGCGNGMKKWRRHSCGSSHEGNRGYSCSRDRCNSSDQ
jgi:hypothetical protein